MAREAAPPECDVEPFDPDRHSRTDFCCGVDRLDNYLKRTARKHQEGDFARVFVAVAPGQSSILGFYSINAHVVEAPDLPDRITRNAPRHDGVRSGIPAAYLSMIAVDRGRQGQGLGVVLLADALKRLIPLSHEIGLAVVVLDVLDDGGPGAFARRKGFYEGMGFQSTPSRQARMFLTMKDIRAAFG